MKKYAALLLAIVLTVSLVGCAAKPDILGSYRAEFDVADLVIDAFNGTENYEVPGFSYKNYIPSFMVALNLTFREDGTYSISTDTEALSASLDNVLTSLNTMLEDMMFSTVQAQMSMYGYQIDSIEQLKELEELTGTDWDAMVSGILNNEMLTSMNQQIIDELFDTLSTPYTIEGNYTAQDGKLCLSFDTASAPSDVCYFTYDVSEDGDVTLTDIAGFELPNISYPLTLTSVE